jgi:hypothetical protein
MLSVLCSSAVCVAIERAERAELSVGGTSEANRTDVRFVGEATPSPDPSLPLSPDVAAARTWRLCCWLKTAASHSGFIFFEQAFVHSCTRMSYDARVAQGA